MRTSAIDIILVGVLFAEIAMTMLAHWLKLVIKYTFAISVHYYVQT
jgi:hypothetical protein